MGCTTIVAPFAKLRMREREDCREPSSATFCTAISATSIAANTLPHPEPVEGATMVVQPIHVPHPEPVEGARMVVQPIHVPHPEPVEGATMVVQPIHVPHPEPVEGRTIGSATTCFTLQRAEISNYLWVIGISIVRSNSTGGQKKKPPCGGLIQFHLPEISSGGI